MGNVVEAQTEFWQSQKLLYVSLNDLSESNGPGVNEREFHASLVERFGDRVHAVIPEPRVACRELSGTHIHHFSRQAGRSPLAFWKSQRALRDVLLEVTEANRFGLIIIRLKALPWGLSEALRHIATPYVVKTVGDPFGICRGRGGKGAVGRMVFPLHKMLTRRVLQGAIAVDCCTPELADVNCRTYGLEPQNVLVVENSTSIHRFYPTDPAVERRRLGIEGWFPVLGYVGGHPSQRGGHEILEAAERLQSDFPQVGVVIVGPGGESELRRRAAELGLQRCLIPGAVDYREVPHIVNALDVGFSLEGLERFRVVGNSSQKVRQYLACGKFVITYIRPDHALMQAGLVKALSSPDTAEIERTVREILTLPAGARIEHARRAAAFVKDQLSTQATLTQRLDLWSSRLFPSATPHSTPHSHGCPRTARRDQRHGDALRSQSSHRDAERTLGKPRHALSQELPNTLTTK